MPKRSDIKKVLVIGSGPIVIGQAAEFDYAGAQACRVMKSEGVNVVLCNSNPATIMTDKALAVGDFINLNPTTATGEFTISDTKIVVEEIVTDKEGNESSVQVRQTAGVNQGKTNCKGNIHVAWF